MNPTKMHMTVPFGFKKKSPESIELHLSPLSKLEVEKRNGYLVTTVLRTLVDVVSDQTVDAKLIKQSIKEAHDRRLVTRIELYKSRAHYKEIDTRLGVLDGQDL